MTNLNGNERDEKIRDTPVKVEMDIEEVGSGMRKKRKKETQSSPEVKQNIEKKLEDRTCVVCGKVFAYRCRYLAHLKLHDNIKEFVCLEDGCGKAFSRADNLRIHIKGVHRMIRDYICPYCPYAFSSSSHLKRHVWKMH